MRWSEARWKGMRQEMKGIFFGIELVGEEVSVYLLLVLPG